jgi:hypothetical protein
MTSDRVDYLKNWFFRANEDILVMKSLFESPRAHSPLLAAESASIKNLP